MSDARALHEQLEAKADECGALKERLSEAKKVVNAMNKK